MNDKALSNAEMELTQKIQMHFPRGVITVGVLQKWSGCPKEVLTARLTEAFGRFPEPAVEPVSLFDHIGVLDFPGLSAFNTDIFFTTDTPEGAAVKFTYVGENFNTWFGGMKVAATGAIRLSLDRLRAGAYDLDANGEGIIKEIGDENCNQSLAVIRWHIESGLAKKSNWYAGYFLDKGGVRRAVGWNWRGRGWRVAGISCKSAAQPIAAMPTSPARLPTTVWASMNSTWQTSKPKPSLFTPPARPARPRESSSNNINSWLMHSRSRVGTAIRRPTG